MNSAFNHYAYSTKNINNTNFGFSLDYNKNHTIDIYEHHKTLEMVNLNTIAYLLLNIPISYYNNKTFYNLLEDTIDTNRKNNYNKLTINVHENYNSIAINHKDWSISNNSAYYGYEDFIVYYLLRYIKENNIDVHVKCEEHSWFVDLTS